MTTSRGSQVGVAISFHFGKSFVSNCAFAIVLPGPVLAAVRVVAVRDFDFVAAASITVACLTVCQLSYLVRALLSRNATRALFGDQSDDHIRENRQEGVPRVQNPTRSYLA